MVIMVAHSLICSPFLISLNQSKIRKKNKKIPGNSPGYIRKESEILPSSKKEMDRWIPHPGQSSPINCLLIQGNIQLSFIRSSTILVRNAHFHRSFFIIYRCYFCYVDGIRQRSSIKTITYLICSRLVGED